MSVFTESAVCLRDGIVAWRQAREALRHELERTTKARQHEVSSLLAAFADDLAGARRAWLGATPAGGRAAGREKQPGHAEAARARPGTDRPHPKRRKKR